jgi:hypothetical protein
MDLSQEAKTLWTKLERNFATLSGIPIATRGLGGRASGKRFIPNELKSGRLYIAIEGRDGTPKQTPFINLSDLEAYLRFEKRDFTSEEARKSFRTSYAGPLVERIRSLPS